MIEQRDLLLTNNVKKLNNGQTIRNYLIMCEILEEKSRLGNSRICQIKNWKRFFEWEIQGHKYKINKVFDSPLDRIIIQGGNNKKDYIQYCVERIYDNCVGVYSITKDNQIYIGSTTVGFRHRFSQHISKDTKARELLLSGGIYQIVWSLEQGEENEIRMKEDYYIKEYKNNSEYIVINERIDLFKNKNRKVYETIKVLKKDKSKVLELLKSEKIQYIVLTRKKIVKVN